MPAANRPPASVRMRLPLQAVIESPFPLLQATVREFRGAADGSESEVARIVQYILTTAAQYRALQGYAAGRFGEPGTTTADILTPGDVEVAVNLALLLEQLRRFRSFDEGSAQAFDSAFFAELAGRYLGEAVGASRLRRHDIPATYLPSAITGNTSRYR